VHARLARSLTVAALLWVTVIFAAPYAIASGNTPLVAAATFVYQGAGLICHQRPERSFHIAGVQLPVCGRCLGLYLSGAIGALAAWFGTLSVAPRKTRLLLVVAAVPTAVTVSLEFLGLIHPTNLVRAWSALPLGAAAAWIFVRSLRADAEVDARAAAYARTQPS
jgi:uncharacterized membrane protein